MGIEIERKFLVLNNDWKSFCDASKVMKQGYLSRGSERSIRVRISGDDQAFINIKSSRDGISRLEFEYAIPVADAEVLLNEVSLKPFIDKTRYYIKQGKHTWEIDVFRGDNAGLVVAEIELESVDEVFDKPDWLGVEVSDDSRYYNMNLIALPYNQWPENNSSGW